MTGMNVIEHEPEAETSQLSRKGPGEPVVNDACIDADQMYRPVNA